MLDGHQGVHGLAGLADRHDQRGAVDDRVAVAELVGEADLDRDAGPVLDRVLGDHAGVGGGAAGDDGDAVDGAQLLLADPHLVEHEPAGVVGAPEQGVGHRVRLVVDLLLHERRVATLLGGGGVPGDLVGLAVARGAVEVDDRVAVGGDRDDLVLAELERVPGVADERRDVAAEEVLAVAQAHDERAVAAGAHDDAGAVGVHREQGERPLEPLHDVEHGHGEVAHPVVLAADELGRHLGVGLGEEHDALGEQLLLEGVEVLDDAVVDQGEPVVVAAAVRVRVAVGGATVGRPAGVPDAGARRGQRVRLERRAEVLELAGALLGRDAVGGDQGDARRVVPAVLEPGEPFHHDLEGRVIHGPPDVAHDSAHAGKPSWEPPRGGAAVGRPRSRPSHRRIAPASGRVGRPHRQQWRA